MKVKISLQALYNVKFASSSLPTVTDKKLFRQNLHKLLDQWIDKPNHAEIGDNLVFEVVED